MLENVISWQTGTLWPFVVEITEFPNCFSLFILQKGSMEGTCNFHSLCQIVHLQYNCHHHSIKVFGYFPYLNDPRLKVNKHISLDFFFFWVFWCLVSPCIGVRLGQGIDWKWRSTWLDVVRRCRNTWKT